MNGRWVNRNIEAVRHLRSTYRLAKDLTVSIPWTTSSDPIVVAKSRRGYSDYKGYDCPLCVVNLRKSRVRCLESRESCKNCPWMVFNNIPCYTACYGRDPVNKRIERLNDWEKRLLEMRKEFRDGC